MDTWNTDRIYTWFGEAIGHSDQKNRKFYFDFSDNTFFDLMLNDGKYLISDKTTFSSEHIILLASKIVKIKNMDASILEINKSKRSLLHLFDQTTSYENYTKREEEWNFVNDEIKIFINKHSIPIYKAILIE